MDTVLCMLCLIYVENIANVYTKNSFYEMIVYLIYNTKEHIK